MSGEVVVLVPVLRRPHRVAPLINSLVATAPSARLVFLCSPEDQEEQEVIDSLGADRLTMSFRSAPGDYAKKINEGYRQTSEPFMFLGADDVEFHPGWLEAAMSKVGPAQVVGTNDLGNARVMRGEHATHSLVSREYVDKFGTIDEPGKVLHEGYPHEFVDDEFVCTAKYRDAWAFAADSIVEHLHPNWNKAPSDPLYAQQRVRMNRGRRVFQRRERLWT